MDHKNISVTRYTRAFREDARLHSGIRGLCNSTSIKKLHLSMLIVYNRLHLSEYVVSIIVWQSYDFEEEV